MIIIAEHVQDMKEQICLHGAKEVFLLHSHYFTHTNSKRFRRRVVACQNLLCGRNGLVHSLRKSHRAEPVDDAGSKTGFLPTLSSRVFSSHADESQPTSE